MPHEYKVEVVKVVDGDTVDVDIDLGFGLWLKKQRVRLKGIDTPESRTSDKVEKVFGLAAKDFLIQQLQKSSEDGTDLVLRTKIDKERGKYGRILGEFILVAGAFKTNINKKLVEEHHAVEYWGQSKQDVKSGHYKNREILREQNFDYYNRNL
tara:strand:- start:27 stop:485 length:459 start_codon:yes stop_codon:yes gene_type:complete